MVQRDLADRGITDEAVLDAMRTVPREQFVPAHSRVEAFADCPLPIGQGQTISQPYIVAAMAEAARLSPTDHVLEVGTGSGYGAAVLRELAASVVTVERHTVLAEAAAARLGQMGYDDIEVVVGDGSLGWPDRAPFDAIVVTAAGPKPPDPLLGQLADGGRLVVPIGERKQPQTLVLMTRSGERFHRKTLGGVRFVPLIGEYGFRR